MKRIQRIFNRDRSAKGRVTKNHPLLSEDSEVVHGQFLSGTVTGQSGKKLISKSKRSSIHPNLRLLVRNYSSIGSVQSDSPLSIEEPLCTYLSLFDGTSKKDLTDVQTHIDNLFSDNFIHMMDGEPIDKSTFIQINEKMLQRGVVATLEDISFIDDFHVEYTVHWYYNDYNSRVTHVTALVVDKKIVKLEPCRETRGAFANRMEFFNGSGEDKENMIARSSSSCSNNHSSTVAESTILPDFERDTKVLTDNAVASVEKTSYSRDMEKCGALQRDSDAMKKALNEKVASLEKIHKQDIKKCEALQKEIDEMKITMASLEDKIRHDKLQDMQNGGNKRRGNRRSNSEKPRGNTGSWFRLRLRRKRTG